MDCAARRPTFAAFNCTYKACFYLRHQTNHQRGKIHSLQLREKHAYHPSTTQRLGILPMASIWFWSNSEWDFWLLLFCLVSRRTRSRHRNGRAWCIEKHWLLLNTQHWNRIAVQPLGYHEEKTQIMSKIFSVALIIQIRDCITLFTLNWTVLYVEQLPARWSWTRESAQVFWLDEAPTSIVLLFCSLHMHWFDIRATNRSTNISIYSFYVWSQKYIVSVSITYTVELRRCLRNQELSHPSNKYQETNQTTNPHLNFIAQRCRVRLIRSGPLHRNID